MRNAIDEARAAAPPTTPEQRASLVECAGSDQVDAMDHGTRLLTEEEWGRLRSCIVELGLEKQLLFEFDPAEVGLVDLYNQQTHDQIECLTEQGWAVAAAEPDEDGYIEWDVVDSALMEDPEFMAAAQECVEQSTT